ncbi:GntR family transcriptional regulator [Embleya sp. NPDC055664]
MAGAQGLPPYRRIAAEIRARIDRGELRPGDRVPSVREIVEAENVSIATATRVAAVLRADGYAESIPGVGTIVTTPRRLTTGPDRLALLRATGTGFRSGERVEILSAELVVDTGHVTDALGLADGTEVVRRRRLYRDDEGVIALSTSWLSGQLAEVAPELLVAEPLPTMTFGLVEERSGRRAIRRRDVVALRPVPEDAAAIMGVEPGTPALTMTNLYWDQHDNPTEYAMDILGAGRELSADYALD